MNKIKILHIDDDPEIAIIVQLWSEIVYKNVTVDVASSGDVAVRKIQKKNYDLLIVDQSMPNMDGCNFIKLLREGKVSNDKRTQCLPVVICSARVQASSKEKFKLIANYVISKPLSFDAFVDIFEDLNFDLVLQNEDIDPRSM